jgi:hypothetical protein
MRSLLWAATGMRISPEMFRRLRGVTGRQVPAKAGAFTRNHDVVVSRNNLRQAAAQTTVQRRGGLVASRPDKLRQSDAGLAPSQTALGLLVGKRVVVRSRQPALNELALESKGVAHGQQLGGVNVYLLRLALAAAGLALGLPRVPDLRLLGGLHRDAGLNDVLAVEVDDANAFPLAGVQQQRTLGRLPPVLLECNDPVKTCSGVTLRGVTR